MPASPRQIRYRSAARSSRELEVSARRLGQRLRVLRQRAQLTQEQVAERARLEVKHVQHLERPPERGSNPTLATLVAISRALGVKIGELFEH